MTLRPLTAAALLILAACAGNTPLPDPTGPIETTTVSRDVFQKGVITNGRPTTPPSIVRRTYPLACGTAPDGASLDARAKRAVAIMEQASTKIGQGGIGHGIIRQGELRAINPTLLASLNCKATNMTAEIVTTDQAEVLRFVLDNNLMAELAARR